MTPKHRRRYRSNALIAPHFVMAFMAGLLLTTAPIIADDEPTDLPGGIDWQVGPTTGQMGSVAEIQVPENYIFAGAADTTKLMRLYENPTDGSELGYISPTDMSWYIVFEYDDVGYVKDDEKDDLDPDAMIASIRESNKHGNAQRSSMGWAPLEIVGWEKPPYYDAATNNLVWATRISSEGQMIVNYNTRRLGRSGVMRVTLVVDPEQLNATIPDFDRLMQGFTYLSGQKYSEFRSGDKIAEYGLAALVTGGAVAVAAKTGLLKYLWKIIVVAVVAIGAVFKKIFGGGTKSAH